MNIQLPDEIPLAALAGALASLGLVLDGRAPADGAHRCLWASEARTQRCAQLGCVLPRVVMVEDRGYCAAHAAPRMNAEVRT